MKMVKSLLLGSAAGLVAVTAGQAADLPVKAKPVEYVKVCSLYGAGFYYMPGTDLCLKIGGWVRAEVGWGYNGSLTWGPFNGNVNNRTTNNLVMRARGYITADAREQTAYGTARGYIAVGISTTDVGLNTSANQFSANRAFVQFAGITAGLSQSFYDYYSVPAASYNGDYPASDTGDPGWWVFGYTAQLGNGLSASLALEERRTTRSSMRRRPRRSVRLLAPSRPAASRPRSLASAQTMVLTAASRSAISSAIFGSTRLGAVRRSWARCTKTMPATTA